VVRSDDFGRSWEAPVAAASKAGSEFEEPAIIRLASGAGVGTHPDDVA